MSESGRLTFNTLFERHSSLEDVSLESITRWIGRLIKWYLLQRQKLLPEQPVVLNNDSTSLFLAISDSFNWKIGRLHLGKVSIQVKLQSWTNVLGHFCISGHFPIHTGPASPLLTLKRMNEESFYLRVPYANEKEVVWQCK